MIDAWELESPAHGRLWLVRDHAALELLAADDPAPVIFASELDGLRALDAAGLAAVLDVKRTWPGARVVSAEAVDELRRQADHKKKGRATTRAARPAVVEPATSDQAVSASTSRLL